MEANWLGDHYEMCTETTALLDFDAIATYLGSEAAADAAELPCDLGIDCIDYLAQPAQEALWSSPVEDLESTAEVQMVTSLGEVQLLGGSWQEMEGEVAFSSIECGEAGCPFYLAKFELAASSPFTVQVPIVGSSSLTKVLSNLTVTLERPALGIWTPGKPGYDWVIFPPNSLMMRISASVSGSTNYYSENGSYDELYLVNDYVYGYIDDGPLNLHFEGADILGSFNLYADFAVE